MTDWLDQVKARLKAATPGPWHPNIQPFETGDWSGVDGDNCGIVAIVDRGTIADIKLIAHAPTDLDKAIRIIECYERALNFIVNDARSFGLDAEPYCERSVKTLDEAEKIKGEG